MRRFTARSTALTVSAALLTTGLVATPAPVEARGGYYGPYYGGSYYGGYGGRYRHRDRIDAGDVIGGILLIGTIAAVASAAITATTTAARVRPVLVRRWALARTKASSRRLSTGSAPLARATVCARRGSRVHR